MSIIISSSVCLDELRFTKQTDSQIVTNTQAAAGWILFLSLIVCMYQIFAIFQLFFYLKLLYMKIPVGKSLWYLFPLMVSEAAIAIATYMILRINIECIPCTTLYL